MGDRQWISWSTFRSSVPAGTVAAFAFVAIVIVGLTWLTLTNLKNISHNAQLVLDAHETARLLSDVLAKMVDSETAQRGYIITGDDAYLQPFRDAGPKLANTLQLLQEYAPPDSQQQREFAELKTTVHARLQALEKGIRLRRDGGVDAARNFVLTGQGKREMDAVRSQIAELQLEQAQILARRSSDSERSHNRATSTIFGATALALAVAMVACLLSLREINLRQRTAKELERRVQQRTQELNETNLALQQSNRELEQFASVASHDLQEPLRKIEAFGDRLNSRCRAALEPQGIEYLDRVLVSASRMRTLINDLLSYARVASRAQPFSRIDCGQIVREVVSDLETRINELGARVETDPLPTIDADPTQFRQLIQNLISNALKFHKPDVAPVVRISAELFDDDENPPICRLQVMDNGIGFDEVYLDRIFEVFQRLHGRSEYEGTGIGLAICRKIVERHNGTITARSQPGEGATFIIMLPVHQTSEK